MLDAEPSHGAGQKIVFRRLPKQDTPLQRSRRIRGKVATKIQSGLDDIRR